MKAVLVLDIPNDIDINQLRIGGDGNIYYIRNGERASIVGNIRNIKPLPLKYPPMDGLVANCEPLTNAYEEGWNECLDKIAGETK